MSHGNNLAYSVGSVESVLGYKKARSGVNSEPKLVGHTEHRSSPERNIMHSDPGVPAEIGGVPPRGVGKVRVFFIGDVESPEGVDTSYSTHRESWVKAKFDATL